MEENSEIFFTGNFEEFSGLEMNLFKSKLRLGDKLLFLSYYTIFYDGVVYDQKFLWVS